MKQRVRRLKMLWKILKRTRADKIVIGYVITLCVVAGLMMFAEPNIKTYGDSLWYCYTMGVTVGLGDFVPITFSGRILSVFISLYSLLLIGMIPAIIVSYYMEIIKAVENESVTEFFDQLENLPELSKMELQALSERIKSMDKRCLHK
ncbi:MAG: potassium channel family protein [Anaerovoracaceae bacterium]